MPTSQEHRADVERELGRKMTRAEWAHLQESPEWLELRQGIHDERDCVDVVRDFERVASTRAAAASEGGDDADVARVVAASLVMWERMNADEDVIAFRAGGMAADEVRSLERALVRNYQIEPNQARAFLEDGAVPLVRTIWVQTKHSLGTTRIQLDVHVDASVEAVAAAYAAARHELVGRRRRPPESSLRLVSMWFEHRKPGYRALAELWNRKHPDQPTALTARTARTKFTRAYGWLGGQPYERTN